MIDRLNVSSECMYITCWTMQRYGKVTLCDTIIQHILKEREGIKGGQTQNDN